MALNLLKQNGEHVANLEAISLIYNHKKATGQHPPSVYLTVDDLQAIIDEINTLPEKSGHGARFYLAQYPSSHPTRPYYQNSKTLVVVPACKKTGPPQTDPYGNETGTDFLDVSTVKGYLHIIDPNSYPEPAGPLPKIDTATASSFDHYPICPPYCNGANIAAAL